MELKDIYIKNWNEVDTLLNVISDYFCEVLPGTGEDKEWQRFIKLIEDLHTLVDAKMGL